VRPNRSYMIMVMPKTPVLAGNAVRPNRSSVLARVS